MSAIVNGYVLPVVNKSLYHVTCSVRTVPMVVGHLLLLAPLSGTLCPMTCGIWRFLRTLTDSLWRRFYLRSTSVFSTLKVFFTRMHYINPHLTLTSCFTRLNSLHDDEDRKFQSSNIVTCSSVWSCNCLFLKQHQKYKHKQRNILPKFGPEWDDAELVFAIFALPLAGLYSLFLAFYQ